MNFFKIYFLIGLFVFLSSCGTVKDAFSNQMKNSSDEFLVEKKSPLVMPPDYDELLVPKQDAEKSSIGENKIKELVKTDDFNNETIKNNKSLDKAIINKIKKN